jgi:DNA repair protein RadC
MSRKKKKRGKFKAQGWRGIVFRLQLVKENAGIYTLPVGFTGAADVNKMFGPVFRHATQEEFWIVTADTKNRVTGASRVSQGTLDASLVHPRDVFGRAIVANAASIVLIHNHPSGDPEPSGEDIHLTRRMAEAGEMLGIPVLDHVVIGDDAYVSLAERGVC